MQAKKNPEELSIRYIKGVGPQKADIFEKVGVQTVSDLFYYLPRRYEDRSNIVEVEDLKVGEHQAVIGKVLSLSLFRAKTGTNIFQMTVGNDKRRVYAVWYNQPYMKKVFSKGQTVVLYGKVEVTQHLQISHPIFEILEGDTLKESLNVGRIVPIYPLTESLTQKYLRKIVAQSLHSHAVNLEDPIPTKIRARQKLVDAKFAIENIHFPYSDDNLEKAYKRLIFEEFFILQVMMALRRRKMKQKGVKHEVGESLMADFKRLFPFEFTGEQKKCIKDIQDDMSSDKPMYRLLQGDVGSGKTVVAMYALLLSVANNYQAAFMAPTEILAQQHYVTISKTFMPLGINVRLLVSGIDKTSSDTIKKEISGGDADIVIGTHALIQEKVDYKSLGLVVIDEQHKFGVEQRKKLREKGKMPDTLFMTATPIPRSLILTLFGDMDISLLKEKPEGREDVTTYLVSEEKRELVYGFVRDEIGKGRQAFIVYPRIEDTGKEDLRSAEEMYKKMSEEIFADLKVELVHGRMKPNEKKKIMEGFRDGKFDVLVATTVIEVGVDMPNASVMLVEHAERYGLAQLHQLRGRIGRGEHASYCILMGQPETDASFERLQVMTETSDGFQIAEKDLEIRGPGELLGTRQSGLPELKIGDIVRDFKIMEEARKEAFEVVEEDPDLIDPHHVCIKKAIKERFGEK